MNEFSVQKGSKTNTSTQLDRYNNWWRLWERWVPNQGSMAHLPVPRETRKKNFFLEKMRCWKGIGFGGRIVAIMSWISRDRNARTSTHFFMWILHRHFWLSFLRISSVSLLFFFFLSLDFKPRSKKKKLYLFIIKKIEQFKMFSNKIKF